MNRNNEIKWSRVESSLLDLVGKNVAVVGGTGGIGRALSRLMADRGAKVTVVGQTFREDAFSGIEFIQADLSLMMEAQRVGKILPAEELDIVVFTAGIFAAPKRQVTSEGLEKDMAVSYLNRFVILREIGARLGKRRHLPKSKVRVFIMGFPGAGQSGDPSDLNAEREYKTMAVHMNTVAANEALVLESARYFSEVNFYGLNPGIVKTNIRSNLLGEDSLKFKLVEWLVGLFTPTAEEYANGIVPLIFSPEIEGHSGSMFDRKGFAIYPSKKLTDQAYCKEFTMASENLLTKIGIKFC